MERKILVTAGSTAVPIDRVRNISNIFKGNTGASIALEFAGQGDKVTLITSHGHLLNEQAVRMLQVRILNFRTYDELLQIMETEIKTGGYDVVIHSAAVSDYQVAEVCVMDNEKLMPLDKSKKVGSNHSDLYLHLKPTQKIIDLIRKSWGFKGYLVKFKLQVGISDEELIQIAKQSRIDSAADMIVANCLEWAKYKAYIITDDDTVNVSRTFLPDRIYEQIENAL